MTAQGSPDMTLAVAAGTVRIAAVDAAVTAGNVTITTANATNPRIDLVVVNSSGTKSVTAGTAAAAPVAPAIPATSVVLAMVYVPANDAAINTNQITDKRCDLASFVAYSSTLAGFPAASAANAGQLSVATDVNGGTLYRSSGSAWTQVAPSVSLALSTKGDIPVGQGSSAWNRFAVGAAGSVLMPDSSASWGLAWITSQFVGSVMPTGAIAETVSRFAGSASATVAAGTTGQMRVVAIWLPARVVVTSITFVSGSTALASGTNGYVALYNASTLALLRQSTTDASIAWAASTAKTFTLSSTFTTTYAGNYYLGLCITAGTMPTLTGFAGSGTLNSLDLINSGTATGAAATAPNPLTTVTGVGGVPYAYVS